MGPSAEACPCTALQASLWKQLARDKDMTAQTGAKAAPPSRRQVLSAADSTAYTCFPICVFGWGAEQQALGYPAREDGVHKTSCEPALAVPACLAAIVKDQLLLQITWQAQDDEELQQHLGSIHQLQCIQLHEGLLCLTAGVG